ncbi:MAG TPA: HAD family phosphatase [Candidatus Eisenbergiella merdavium]|uniref:HAD family phosphatase n=1 Tax=Candidatus Eisenbergiella merdavium TaxID=2838551 RepID=A0A9D2NGQ4_9FIRM|nr:HAD family phosphatase [Candidatus Eisenbergiella merdavium]
MIRTIIFDIGNVLTVFGWKNFLKSFGFDAQTEERVGKATMDNPFWNEMDRGKLSEEEMLEGFIQNDPSVEKEIRQIYENLHGILTKANYAIPWIKELKAKGYQVLVLSNFSEKVARENADALDFLEYVDGGILSYKDGVIKPDPAIYRLLLDRYGLKPEECVFLDDVPKNVDAAAAFGIATILFRNQEQAMEELRALGVE